MLLFMLQGHQWLRGGEVRGLGCWPWAHSRQVEDLDPVCAVAYGKSLLMGMPRHRGHLRRSSRSYRQPGKWSGKFSLCCFARETS